MSFYANLNRVMKERNVSQTDLHNLTGIGKSSISQYLSGKNTPKGKTIEAIAEALECSVDDLVDEKPVAYRKDAEGVGNNVPILTAAAIMGKSEQYVRVGIQSGRLPIGSAVKMSSKYSYYISPKLLYEHTGIDVTGGTFSNNDLLEEIRSLRTEMQQLIKT